MAKPIEKKRATKAPTAEPSRRAAAGKKLPYTEPPSVAMERKIVGELKERTGRSLEQWIELVRRKGPPGEPARVAWLRKEHGLGTSYSNWLARAAEVGGLEEYDPGAMVVKMYAGPKAGLLPLHAALVEHALALGPDVTLAPCSTIVPIRRRFVIAQIKPTTRTRIDFGLALGDTKAKGRLIDTGGFAKKDRISHRIEVHALEDIDGFLLGWLRRAYERDA